ncbi:MAG: cyclic pyranopterin monophosphate synthase MoaC [Actinobacteria bacterium]|nr:cyclic pyranopterin monophosphate synthase MoaC [Actinomycetota bacterium]
MNKNKDKSKKFSHIGDDGKARMVDVSDKNESLREAEAVGYITLDSSIITKIKRNEIEKGDVLSVSKIAGINAAKKTWELIPLCHQIKLTGIDIEFELLEKENRIKVESKVKGFDRTGVEMEAITSVCVSLLTIYDMCKALSREMRIEGVELVRKTGGKSDYMKLSPGLELIESGEVFSINISEKKGGKKLPVEEAYVSEFGIEGDGHGGNWHRQVSILSLESIKKIKEKGIEANPGDFAENITTVGIRLEDVKVGDLVALGSNVIDVTNYLNYHFGADVKFYGFDDDRSKDDNDNNMCNIRNSNNNNKKTIRIMTNSGGERSKQHNYEDNIDDNIVVLELTQIGKECLHPCRIYHIMGDCIMPREGVFCRVLKPGRVKSGYKILVARKRQQI